ncbi:hypothetical protein QFC20_003541 [Naganishia adeliensis]|uniref:Uncharacterized protein n=1 Tax=Naganishia adeliensis TaxID=92952 RepID=A0ACC2WAI5_9TREE|nr:hypothetical protein QFC20_003541 [Naganishia adeliensis]
MENAQWYSAGDEEDMEESEEDKIRHYVRSEEFQTVMIELAHYLTSIPNQLLLISPTALFLQITAEDKGATFPLERPYECYAHFKMSETEEAPRGHPLNVHASCG